MRLLQYVIGERFKCRYLNQCSSLFTKALWLLVVKKQASGREVQNAKCWWKVKNQLKFSFKKNSSTKTRFWHNQSRLQLMGLSIETWLSFCFDTKPMRSEVFAWRNKHWLKKKEGNSWLPITVFSHLFTFSSFAFPSLLHVYTKRSHHHFGPWPFCQKVSNRWSLRPKTNWSTCPSSNNNELN